MPYSITKDPPITSPKKIKKLPPISQKSTLFQRTLKEAAAVCLIALTFFAFSLPHATPLIGFGLAIGATAKSFDIGEKSWSWLSNHEKNVAKNPKIIRALEAVFLISAVAMISLAFWHSFAALPFGAICGIAYTLSSDYLKSEVSKDYERKPVYV